MDPSEKMPEERIGAVEMMRKRAEQCLALAVSCEDEARESTQAAARLRARADRLREVAIEYGSAANIAERGPATFPSPLRAPTTVGGEEPENPQGGDVWMQRDPVDPTTYRRLEYDPDLRNGPNAPGGWTRRSAEVGS